MNSSFIRYLRICPCLACVYRVVDACGKFGEHKKCVRVARGAKSMSKFFYNRVTMNKNILRHLIYERACVNKDFVRSGSIGLI